MTYSAPELLLVGRADTVVLEGNSTSFAGPCWYADEVGPETSDLIEDW